MFFYKIPVVSERMLKKIKAKSMQDLSIAIGVSRPTLSKYFQHPETVRLSTRLRIQQGLEKVDYIPNFFATKMNRRSTRLIGVIIPHLNDLYFTSLAEAIEQSVRDAGYMLIIQNSDGSSELEAQAVRNLISMSADGAIIAPLHGDCERSSIKQLQESIPAILIDSYFPGEFEDIDFVGTDNYQSVALIVDYLCETGDAPVYFGMPPYNSNSFERERAYRKRMDELDLEAHVINPEGIKPSWQFEKFAFDVMEPYFSSGEYADSTILCANDRLAIGVLRAAHQHHLMPGRTAKRPGRGLRVAGHDDHPLSAYFNPGLTTVSQNTGAISRAAVRRLLQRIGGDKGETQRGEIKLFQAELKVREST